MTDIASTESSAATADGLSARSAQPFLVSAQPVRETKGRTARPAVLAGDRQ